MEVQTNREEWNNFVAKHGPRAGQFLQSWEWGGMQKELGHNISRFSTKEAVALTIEHSLPIGRTYHYIPRGPIGVSQGACEDLIRLVADKYKKDIFLRVDSISQISNRIGFRVSKTKDVQPSTTLITSLFLDESEILEKMRGKTRYNVRLAKKHGVEIDFNVTNGLDTFMDLVEQTASRHGIRAHGKDHYKMILKHFNGADGSPRAFLAAATHEKDVLAVAMCVDWNGTRTYLHGASSDNKKNFMAPYLLHFELMTNAKREGMMAYDWAGIAPEGQPEHSLQGVTRFKKGFGGEIVLMPNTVDIVMRSLWYKSYILAKRFMR